MQKLDKSKFTMGLMKKEKLAPYLDKALREFDEPFPFEYQPKEPDDAWHPSGDCTPTPLELFEKAEGHLEGIEQLEAGDAEVVPASISPSLRKSFLVGHYWHQLLQYIILNKLEFCEPEDIERRGSRVWGSQSYLNLDEGFLTGDPFNWVAGAGDVVPLILPKDWEGVLDIKTMSARSFGLSTVPFADKYECQVNIYMDIFDQEQAMILGVCKDTPHDFKEILWERNQPLIDTIYDKWYYVSECLAMGVAPSIDDAEKFSLPLSGPVIA